MKKSLTIFTPTYNRAYCLPKLYQSLLGQTCMDFEWVVVDDGSTDNTRTLIESWNYEKNFPIIYIYQNNSGKHCAHNEGVRIATGELFVCVDSDDYLKENAVECILNQWKEQDNVIGILNFRVSENGDAISKIKSKIEYSTLYDAYHLYGLVGDTMLVYKTEIMKRHKFPRFANEKFVPEGFLYDQLDKEGQLYIGKEKIYVCEYREDGYTASIHKVNATNPRGYKAYILQRIDCDYLLKHKFRDIIRLISIKKVLHEKMFVDIDSNILLSCLAFFPGVLRYFVLYKKYI